MNAKELAEKLTGAEYPFYPDKELMKAAKAAGLVVVYGASDDLMEIDGASSEEIGAYNGTTAAFTRDGLLQNKCEDEECPYFAAIANKAVMVEALWCKEPGYSWTYRTTIPHATFEIVEDGGPYCRGIVFALMDVAA